MKDLLELLDTSLLVSLLLLEKPRMSGSLVWLENQINNLSMNSKKMPSFPSQDGCKDGPQKRKLTNMLLSLIPKTRKDARKLSLRSLVHQSPPFQDMITELLLTDSRVLLQRMPKLTRKPESLLLPLLPKNTMKLLFKILGLLLTKKKTHQLPHLLLLQQRIQMPLRRQLKHHQQSEAMIDQH